MTDLATIDAREVVAHAPDPALAVIALLGQAREWLTQATAIEDVEMACAQAEAVRAYTAQLRLGEEAQQSAGELVVRAKRRLGELLGPPVDKGGDPSPRSDGLPRQDRHRLRSLAAIPEPEFEATVTELRSAGKVPTPAAIRRAHAENERAEMLDAFAAVGVHPLIDPDEIAAQRERLTAIANFGHLSAEVMECAGRYSPEQLVELCAADMLWPSYVERARRAIAYLTEIVEAA